MKPLVLLCVSTYTLLLSCSKTDLTLSSSGNFEDYWDSYYQWGGPITSNPLQRDTILIDASRDGGLWWFPQSEQSGFSTERDHQGKYLADHLKQKGFKVVELYRGAVISDDLLSRYRFVIRAGGYGNYSQDELTAYSRFLSREVSLLLLQDHLANRSNDALSRMLDLNFTGMISGPVGNFAPHPVTANANLSFTAGSFLNQPDTSKVTLLGFITGSSTNDSTRNVVMGIRKHPTARIFFIGDVNGLEQIPQPLTTNLFRWLAE
ncbi:MAG: hypothetical protein ACO25B_02870 [Chitinophagaceae bacterium]